MSEKTGVKGWLIDKMRRRTRPHEKFKVSSALERLEKEGFKPIIKADILEGRRKEIRQTLGFIIQVVHNPSYTPEEKGIAVDEAFTLTMSVGSPWLRSMDNPWLAHKMNCFIQNFREWRPIPEFFDQILEEAEALINLAFCNIDIEPLTPILITPGATKETRVIQEGSQREEKEKKHDEETEAGEL